MRKLKKNTNGKEPKSSLGAAKIFFVYSFSNYLHQLQIYTAGIGATLETIWFLNLLKQKNFETICD